MIIAIVNQKGGVGKTTTAVNLAHGIAQANLTPTLLVDLDPQGNCADSLAVDSGNDLMPWLMGFSFHTEPARKNLDLLRSDKKTTQLKAALTGMTAPAAVLVDHIADNRLTQRYQHIIFDCAPSSDLLHIAALMSADVALIPTQLDQLSIKGVSDLLSTLASLQQTGSHCRPYGILPTMFDWVTTETNLQLSHLASALPNLILPVIPRDTACRAASRAGKTLYEIKPTPRALQLLDAGRLIGGYELLLSKMLKEIL